MWINSSGGFIIAWLQATTNTPVKIAITNKETKIFFERKYRSIPYEAITEKPKAERKNILDGVIWEIKGRCNWYSKNQLTGCEKPSEKTIMVDVLKNFC